MPTLSVPLERRLLQSVEEQAATEPVHTWPARSLQTAIGVLRQIRESAADARKELEDKLATGVEARSFARAYGPYLIATDEHVSLIRKLADFLLPAEDPSCRSLVAELRLLEQEEVAFRDLLAEALARASAPARPVDWNRVDAAGEAYAAGKTRPFSRE
jgi:hypothetical protein